MVISHISTAAGSLSNVSFTPAINSRREQLRHGGTDAAIPEQFAGFESAIELMLLRPTVIGEAFSKFVLRGIGEVC